MNLKQLKKKARRFYRKNVECAELFPLFYWATDWHYPTPEKRAAREVMQRTLASHFPRDRALLAWYWDMMPSVTLRGTIVAMRSAGWCVKRERSAGSLALLPEGAKPSVLYPIVGHIRSSGEVAVAGTAMRPGAEVVYLGDCRWQHPTEKWIVITKVNGQ